MKKFTGPIARLFAISTFVASLATSTSVIAQESPAIEAFIAGIDDYEKQTVVTPSVGNDFELPPNQLPADNAEVVVSPPLVPGQVDNADGLAAFSSDDFVGPSQNSADRAGESTTPGENDYFNSAVSSKVVDAPYQSRWLLGVSVPIFNRELDGDRLFSVNPSDSSQALNSSSADPGGASGIDLNLSRRNSFGWGWEARYWGLFAAQNTAILGGSPVTDINGLNSISDGGTTLADTFAAADFHTLTRDYSMNNVELNMLRNGTTWAPMGKGLTVEWLGGLRFLSFDETLNYSAISSTNTVIRSELNSAVENSLFGAQLGGRGEWHLFSRASFTFGAKLGAFNNHASNTLSARNQAANLTYSTPQINNGTNAGAPFVFGDTSKNDIAFMGELDLGLTYQMTLRSRLRAGYRVLGATGIADAEKNIPADFNNVTELRSANTYGDLVLRGGYIGMEWCF